MIERYRALKCSHAGRVLKKRVLDVHDISVKDAAEKMYISRQHLSNFVNGRCGLSVDLALKLEKATGIKAETWLNIQQVYDLNKESQKEIKAEKIINGSGVGND